MSQKRKPAAGDGAGAEGWAEVQRALEALTQAQTRLEAAVERLAEAQAHTEEQVGRLDGHVGRLGEALVKLTEAQARTEERVTALESRMDRVEVALERLAEAQARTEERVGQLEERTGRLEEAVTKLAEAQARTEIALQQLARQVGGLSETVGGDIEDIAYIVLHDVLAREFGWQVGKLERSWQTWDGEPEEVNVFGQAYDPARPGEVIWIVGEAKHNLSLKEVERFIRQVERARRHLAGEVFAVCFCYRARPEVRQRVREAGLRLVFSYGKIV